MLIPNLNTLDFRRYSFRRYSRNTFRRYSLDVIRAPTRQLFHLNYCIAWNIIIIIKIMREKVQNIFRPVYGDFQLM